MQKEEADKAKKDQEKAAEDQAKLVKQQKEQTAADIQVKSNQSVAESQAADDKKI